MRIQGWALLITTSRMSLNETIVLSFVHDHRVVALDKAHATNVACLAVEAMVSPLKYLFAVLKHAKMDPHTRWKS